MSSPARARISVESLETRTLLAADLGLVPIGPETQGVEVQAVAQAVPHHDGPVVCFDGEGMGMPGDIDYDAWSANVIPTIDEPGGPTSSVDPFSPDSSAGTTDASTPTQADNGTVAPFGPVQSLSTTDAIDPTSADTDSLTPFGPDRFSSTTDAIDPTSTDTDSLTPFGPDRFSSTTDAIDPTSTDTDSLTPFGPDRFSSTTDASDPTQSDLGPIKPWGPDVEVHTTEDGTQTDHVTAVDEVLAAYGSTDRP